MLKRVFFSFYFIQFIYGQLLITEVMYDLDGSDSPNEFIEIFNASSTDTLDLNGWHIRDRTSVDALMDSGYGLILLPESYGLIMEGDYSFANGIYADSIPGNVLLIKVDDSSIGNGLSTQDSIFIISSNGVVQDSVGWTDISPDGFSLEKIRIELPNSLSNWSPSIDSLGTPGKINSVEPLNIDGELIAETVGADPSIIGPNETLTISGYVTNQGRTVISGDVEIKEGDNVLESIFVNGLDELDTTEFSTSLGPFSWGHGLLTVTFLVSNDEDTTNNETEVEFGVRFPEGIITINEFLPYPESGEPEFVEFVYHGDDPLTLTGWGLADRSLNPAEFSGVTINDEHYLVVGADSSLFTSAPDTSVFLTTLTSFPALNNGGDEIKLFDPFNTLIDSLEYSDHWGFSRGQSMEKVYTESLSSDSTNWSPSIDPEGQTPGERNSVMPWPIDGMIISELITYFPTIPSHSDSIQLIVPIRNSGQGSIDGDIYIEYEEEELVSTSFSITTPGDTTTIILSIAPLPSGSHDLFLAMDLQGDGNILNNSDTVQVKVRYPFGTLKINEFMSRPNNDQSEFIELVSFESVYLSRWAFSDNSTQLKSMELSAVSDGDYIILAPDSILYPLENANAHFIVSEDGWGSLNNSGDGIFVYDHTGSIIDSMHYDSNWQLGDEISTEKFRPEFLSHQSSNWALSNNTTGFTPGSSNSIALFDLDGGILTDSIFHEPHFPTNDETVTLYAYIMNMGVTEFDGTLEILINGDEYGTTSFPTIAPGDTLIHGMSFGPLVSGYHSILLDLKISGDENSSNDAGTDTVWVSYEHGSVMLNEFMALPDSTQTEFIELVALENLTMDHWSISDNTLSKRSFSFSDISENDILVIALDSLNTSFIHSDTKWTIPSGGFPALNNSSDDIYLFDMTGAVMDSLSYNENWNMVENRSMEKYRPEFDSSDSSRWAVAVNETGQSPGEKNSVYYGELEKEGQLILNPDPFSPDGDGKDDELYIQYKLPFEYGVISIQIFDVIGREIAVPYWNVYTAQENILTWDGKRDDGSAARIGPYIIKVKAKDSNSSKTWEDIQTVILAKKL